MSDLRTKNQKRQWIDLEIMEEAAEFERDLFDQLGSPRLSAEPIAWIRYCSDGSFEGPIMDNLIEDVRKKSGEWTPLFATREKAMTDELRDERDAEIARLRADAWLREETTSTCWCEKCRPITMYDMRMVLCPECGNKRCPRATNHIYQCTARKDAK